MNDKELLQFIHDRLENIHGEKHECDYMISLRKIIGDLPIFYDPKFGDEKLCECGHTYYRHFDSYEDMGDAGCKYCRCDTFKEKTDG